jgi:Recombinase zinc beta ribbon domain
MAVSRARVAFELLEVGASPRSVQRSPKELAHWNGTGFSAQQGGREKYFPTHLLSGAMVCGKCGATIAEVSGKGGGYYGCLGATKGACDNKLLVRRSLAEKIILDMVRERLSDLQHIEYVLRRVEAEVRKLYTHVPESIHLKETELTAEKRRLANFVDFIGEGRGSRTLALALLESERKVEALREELESLRRNRSKVFQVPPTEWIQERLTKLKEILERNSDRSALLLRKVLGPLRLEPMCGGHIDRPFYKATTSLNTLALVDPLIVDEGPEGGSNSLQWWRRGDSDP